MATIVLIDPHISIAGNDLSGNPAITSVELSYEADAVEATGFGDTTRTNKGGLKNWGVRLNLNSDFGAGGLDDVMFPLVGTEVAVVIRPKDVAVSADNPQYSGTGLLTSFPPLSGEIGALASASAEIVPAGDLARATA